MNRRVLPAGVVLAGGRSRRMEGQIKALAELNGIPLIGHVIKRLQPQVSSLALSVEQHTEALDRFGLRQVEDLKPGSCGPLGGLLAALEDLPAGTDWLLLAPCDAPFLPLDLGERLLECAESLAAPGCIVRYAGELQPTFSVWHRSLSVSMRQSVFKDGMGGFKQFLARVRLPSVDWEQSAVSPFFNVNTLAELELVAGMLRTEGRAAETQLN
ncbi:MAG TPA: molybdenum cofactor guanylyltransferase MobA [Xanthomonadales bacterium]|nr:molybdenum cofactor guanylyltransferase MobA [Xanthomonadales bacterium]